MAKFFEKCGKLFGKVNGEDLVNVYFFNKSL